MKRVLFLLLFFTACSLNLPKKLSDNVVSPVNIEKNGKQVTIYIEQEGNSYSILGIHPLSGREFIIKVSNGKVKSEEYGFIFSKSEVSEILDQVLN